MGILFYFLVYLFPSISIEKFRVSSVWSDIGIRADRWMLRDIAIGFSLALGCLAVISLVALASGASFRQSMSYAPYQVLSLMFSIALRAACEEIVFRGVVYQAIEERFSPLIAALATSLAFSSAHFFNPDFSLLAFLNTLLAGLLLSAMYSLTKSLWLGIAFHATWNILLMLFVDYSYLKVNGFAPLTSLSFSGLYAQGFPSIIFGNEYGIEEGLITTLVLLCCFYPLAKVAQVSPYRAARLLKRSIAESALRDRSNDGSLVAPAK